MTDEPDDASNDYGRYKPENCVTPEDELWGIILDLVEQSCGPKKDELDSWAISAYERAIIALEQAGFVKIEPGGRIYAKILPKARKLQAWLYIKERPNRIAAARRDFVALSDRTPERAERVARRYDITVEELTGEPTGDKQP